jgi:hypothetical protein
LHTQVEFRLSIETPILKEAKAEYEKLKEPAGVRSLGTVAETAAIVFLLAGILTRKRRLTRAFTLAPQYLRNYAFDKPYGFLIAPLVAMSSSHQSASGSSVSSQAPTHETEWRFPLQWKVR